MVNNWEYSYNGLTFGGATVYPIIQADGLNEPPEARADLNDKVGRHGGFSYMDKYTMRRVTISGDMTANTQATFETQIIALKQAFVLQVTPLPLIFKRPGMGGSGQWRLNCKPNKVAIPMTAEYNIQYAPWVVEFVADDPFIYDDALTTTTITGATGGTSAMTNSGIVPLLFENVRINGPGTTFTIKINGSSTETLKILHTLTAGQWLDVDFQDRTIYDQAGVSQYGKLDYANSKWWELPVGTTTVQAIVASGGTAGTNFVYTYRSAWV